jgi:GTP1/Obg family GTP-binding protein
MTCKQLGGACSKKFQAQTFEEMAEMSKKHAMEVANKGDKAHIEKMKEMKDLMNTPGAMKEWFEKVQNEFDALPEDK